MSTHHTRRKKLLVLTSTFPRWKGDTEPPFVFELCRRLSSHLDICVLAPHAPGAAAAETMDGLQVHRFRYFVPGLQELAYRGGILSNLQARRWRYLQVPFFVLAQILAAVRLVRPRRFDCIHAHWLIPQALAAIVAARTAKPAPTVLSTSHGGDLYALGGSGFQMLKRAAVARSAAVTVVSRSMAAALKRLQVPRADIRVIPMGVDLQRRFVPAPRGGGSPRLLYAGRLVEKKGVRHLIDAMPQIAAAHPGVSLVIAGDGREKPDLVKRVSDKGLDSRVTFLGAVPNETLPELYRNSDVVVFPSVVAGGGDREGFGLVLVEALGCECAVVVTDLPAMQDIVTHEQTGLVIPQKNSVRLAEAVIRLLDDPQLRARLGRCGRRHVLERFDWSIVADRYLRLIHSITGDGAIGEPGKTCSE